MAKRIVILTDAGISAESRMGTFRGSARSGGGLWGNSGLMKLAPPERFDEVPYHMERIDAALATADMFVAIGTSGVLHPAAGCARVARHAGADTIALNLEASERA